MVSLGQDATAFQAEVAAILDCVTSCLRKRPVKEQLTICTDSQAAIAARGTKSLLVTNCIQKLTVLLKINQVTIMWVPGHSGIQQVETADRLTREGVRTRPLTSDGLLRSSLVLKTMFCERTAPDNCSSRINNALCSSLLL